jgi:hypothetical protein
MLWLLLKVWFYAIVRIEMRPTMSSFAYILDCRLDIAGIKAFGAFWHFARLFAQAPSSVFLAFPRAH